jgi:RNA polymerase sigma-70 factor (family 1)
MADYKYLSDQELKDLLKASDHSAFAEIYNRYFKLICVFIYKRLGDEDDTKDVVQELFTHLWTKRETITITGPLSSYIYTAARNKMLDFRKRNDIQKKYIQEMEILEADSIMTDHLVRAKQLSELIQKEIDSLPKKMREIFVLRQKTNLSYHEIAEQANVTKETARSHVNHALKILRLKF